MDRTAQIITRSVEINTELVKLAVRRRDNHLTCDEFDFKQKLENEKKELIQEIRTIQNNTGTEK